MSLQTRLFAFFLGIVVLPLAGIGLLGGSFIVREIERRTLDQLVPAQNAAGAVYLERTNSAHDRVRVITGTTEFQTALIEGRAPELQQIVRRELEAEIAQQANPLDYLVAVDSSGKILASELSKPNFLPGVVPPTAEELAVAELPLSKRLLVTRSIVPILSPEPRRGVAWTVVGGYYLDNEFVESLKDTTGVDATFLIEKKATASTLTRAAAAKSAIDVDVAQVRRESRADVAGEEVYAVASEIASDIPIEQGALVMTKPRDTVVEVATRLRNNGLFLLFMAVLGAGLLGFLLARLISGPLRELADGANNIAAGNYDQHIKVRSSDEVGELARSFNEMTERLRIHISELRESREQVKRAYARFGEILRSTHDLDKLLEGVLETSMDTLKARRGLLMWASGPGNLSVRISHGIEDLDFELEPGKGVTGHVADTGDPVRLPNGPDAPIPDPREPGFKTMLSVPLHSQERVIGVLNLYDKEGDRDFSEADMGTLLSLADQAGVAIENVLLHKEAQVQAITDGLTGLWNFRYFQMQFDTELDRAARFHRPFSLIVIDIDNFKTLNDTFGHQAGDFVLIELASRVKEAIRDIDWFARYGGEEFVLILPETDADGGMRTAEKIRAVVADSPFIGELIPDPLSVTVSVGLACFPSHGTDKTTLLRAADMAMYSAKTQGKDRVVMYRAGMS